MPAVDYRARLQPKDIKSADDILGRREDADHNLLWPLYSTNGLLFPYTPKISTGYEVSYDEKGLVHSNYGYNAYIRSSPKAITLSALFTAQTNDEALYMLAMLHFFKSVTKMYFGVSNYTKAGTPPPTLLFSYLGEHQFNRVPVVIKSFDYELDDGVDYVPVNTAASGAYSRNIGVNLPAGGSNGYTYVPTAMNVNVVLDVQYIPIQIRNEFDLDKFRRGSMMGGFI